MVNAADLPVAAFMLADHPDDVLPFSFDSFFVRTQQQPAGDLSPCAKTGLNAPKVVSVMTIFQQLQVSPRSKRGFGSDVNVQFSSDPSTYFMLTFPICLPH